MGKNWRVDDRYNVEYHTNMGYITDESCILMRLLLKKCGREAEIKRDLLIVRRRFSDQNGQVESKVWNENYPATKLLDDILKE